MIYEGSMGTSCLMCLSETVHQDRHGLQIPYLQLLLPSHSHRKSEEVMYVLRGGCVTEDPLPSPEVPAISTPSLKPVVPHY